MKLLSPTRLPEPRLSALAACLLLFPIGLLWSPKAAQAQSAMHCHTMDEEVPGVKPEDLPIPEHLSGVGNVHFQITARPEAQVWFDQGLNLLHDFWDYESARAFEQSIRVDPDCAICYWGLYYAESARHTVNKVNAKIAIEKSVSLEAHASPLEKLFIHATAQHEAAITAAKPGDDPDFSKEIELWRQAVKLDPKDLQGRIFLADAIRDGYDPEGQPRKGQKETLELLTALLKEAPDNSAINHYWIHAVEASPHPEQALRSAQILGSLAPTSGHMVHMPGHIFFRTGDYASAAVAFAASVQADEHYMQTQHVQVDDDWNYVHNLMYAIANLMEAGRLREATTLSAKLNVARGQTQETLYPWSPRDAIERLSQDLPVALRTGNWSAAGKLLAESKSSERWPNLAFLSRSLTAFVTGMQALDEHDPERAERQSLLLDAELWRASQQVNDEDAAKAKKKDAKDEPRPKFLPDALPKPLLKNLSVMSLELRASLLLAKRQAPDAEKLFARAAAEEKDLGYREPPGYIRPVGETEAAALMSIEDFAGAQTALKRVLVDRPKSGFSLYGLALCSEKSGDAQAATAAYKEFVDAWKNADPDLPQLTHAGAFLAQHQQTLAQR
jgi:predicted Zn-dependent protease